MITHEAYADLEVRIFERQEEGYPVEITFSGEQEFPRGYLDPGFLPWLPGASPATDGERLFDWLLAAAPLKVAWAEARGQNPLRRIRLRIDAAARELHTIPWELLRDASPDVMPCCLAADVDTPFSRYLAGRWRPGGPILERPVKLLVAITNPTDLADKGLSQLDVEAEKQLMAEAVAGVDADQLQLAFLEQPATLASLEAELKNGYHLLHIVAHGSAAQDRAYLFLADEDNRVAMVSDAEFAEMLARQGESLRLVFLASCQTAAYSPADAFRGFAPQLIAAGVPAVLAMQDLVPEATAQQFASIFYRQLLRHGYADLASNEARSALLTARLPGASIPVLYMRLRSGLLFGQRGRILGQSAESFWETLLGNIADGYCTPILGPGVTQGLLPSHEEIAHSLARKYNYPFSDRDELPRVAQFVATLDDRRLRRDVMGILVSGFEKRVGSKSGARDQRQNLSEAIAATGWMEGSTEICEAEIHHQLADLNLPLYVTTNPDSFMTLALKTEDRSPVRKALTWRQHRDREAAGATLDPDLLPTQEAPVVLHLFGTDEDPRSMVLTEDDHLDFLACLSRDYEHLLPASVDEALADTTLLFLGYRLEDLDLKVILRGLLTHLDLSRYSQLHVAVQVEAAEVDEAKQQEVTHYFQRYFGNSKIDVYWGSTHQFMTELHTRWKEYGHERP